VNQEYLAKNFVYEKDPQNKWKILSKDNMHGDCEDYALTALYIETGSKFKMALALIFGSAKMQHCLAPSGGGHVVLKYKGYYIDNGHRIWVTRRYLETKGYKFSGWRYWWLSAIIKFALSANKV
tara:strand:+ start:458 stop:829 length:372 start_codon:yes stop_codon:yes gene_type:complete